MERWATFVATAPPPLTMRAVLAAAVMTGTGAPRQAIGASGRPTRGSVRAAVACCLGIVPYFLVFGERGAHVYVRDFI